MRHFFFYNYWLSNFTSNLGKRQIHRYINPTHQIKRSPPPYYHPTTIPRSLILPKRERGNVVIVIGYVFLGGIWLCGGYIFLLYILLCAPYPHQPYQKITPTIPPPKGGNVMNPFLGGWSDRVVGVWGCVGMGTIVTVLF